MSINNETLVSFFLSSSLSDFISFNLKYTILTNIDVDFEFNFVLLVNLYRGQSTREGTVLVYYAKQWVAVCDTAFGYEEAAVACRMLGFKG